MQLHEGIPIGDHKAGFSIDLDCASYFRETLSSSSHKNKDKHKIKNDTSLGENWKAPFDNKKIKIKDVFGGENLFEAPKDWGLDFLPVTQEKLEILLRTPWKST